MYHQKKMSRWRRVLSGLLALIVVLGLLPARQGAAAIGNNLPGEAYAMISGEEMIFFRDDEGKYTNGRLYTVTVQGTTYTGTVYTGAETEFAHLTYDGPTWQSDYYTDSITTVKFLDNIEPNSTAYWFENFSQLETIEGLEKLEVINTENMRCMFYGCASLKELDLSTWDTAASATDMWVMFDGCTSLRKLVIPPYFNRRSYSNPQVLPAQLPEQLTKVWTEGDGNIVGVSSEDIAAMREILPDNEVTKTFFAEEAYAVFDSDSNELLFMRGVKVDDNTVVRSKGDMIVAEDGYHGTVYAGVESELWSGDNQVPWSLNCADIYTVAFLDEIRPLSTYDWFSDCSNLYRIDGLENLNTADVTDMSFMFLGCKSLQSLDLSGDNWNTSKVKSMAQMFYGCDHLASLNLSGDYWDTSAIDNTFGIFENGVNLSELKLPANFVLEKHMMEGLPEMPTGMDKVVVGDSEEVRDIQEGVDVDGYRMILPSSQKKTFLKEDAYAVLSDDGKILTFVRGVKVSDNAVLRTAGGKYTGKVYSGVETVEYVLADSVPWYHDRAYESITKVIFADEITPVSTSCWFHSCHKLDTIENLSNLKTEKVQDMSHMFYGCRNLTSLDLSGDNWNTYNVKSMRQMFDSCYNLQSLDLSAFTTAQETCMEGMFLRCSSLRELTIPANFVPAQQNYIRPTLPDQLQMVRVDDNAEADLVGNADIEIVNGERRIQHSSKKKTFVIDEAYAVFDGEALVFVRGVKDADGTIVYRTNGEFYAGEKVYGGIETTDYDSGFEITPWNYDGSCQSITKVVFLDEIRPRSTCGWFWNCSNLTSIEGLDKLKTDNVQNMSEMFEGCDSLNELTIPADFVPEGLSENVRPRLPDQLNMVKVGDSTRAVDERDIHGRLILPSSEKTFLAGCEISLNAGEGVFTATDGWALLSNNHIAHGIVIPSAPASDLPTPEWAGHNFAGWYNGDTKVETISADYLELTAKWDTNAYAVLSTDGQTLTFVRGVQVNDNTVQRTNGEFYAGVKVYGDIETTNYNEMTLVPWWEDDFYQRITKVVFLDEIRPWSTFGWFGDCSNLTSIEGLEKLNTADVQSMERMFDGCDSLNELTIPAGFVPEEGLSAVARPHLPSQLNMVKVGDSTDPVEVGKNDIDGGQILPSSEKKTFLAGCEISLNAGEGVFTATDGWALLSNNHIANGIVIPSAPASDLPTPVWAGHNFAGWYSGDTKVDIITEDMGLTAKWVLDVNTYAVVSDDGKTLTFVQGSQDGNTVTSVNGNQYSTSSADRIYTDFIDAEPYSNASQVPWNAYASSIETVVFADTIQPKSMARWFQGCGNLATITGLEDHLDTSATTSMLGMFYGCKALKELDLRSFDTASVTQMSYMFNNCSGLETLYVNGEKWNASQVTAMNYMFASCTKLQNLDLRNWDTKKVTNMEAMFLDCRSLQELDLSSWTSVENVTDMGWMFARCANLQELDLSNWDTKKVTCMKEMFAQCTGLQELDLSSWKSVENVESMEGMFWDCSNLTALKLSNWDTKNVTKMGAMFQGCTNLQELDLSNWTSVEKVTNMVAMFGWCNNLKELNLSSWKTPNVTNMENMFSNCENLEHLDIQNFDTARVETMYNMFCDCNSLSELTIPANFVPNGLDDENKPKLPSQLNMVTVGSTTEEVETGKDVDANRYILPSADKKIFFIGELSFELTLEVGEGGQFTATEGWTLNDNNTKATGKVSPNTPATELPKPQWDNHEFTGWYNGDTPVETITEGMTLTAKWTETAGDTVTWLRYDIDGNGKVNTVDSKVLVKYLKNKEAYNSMLSEEDQAYLLYVFHGTNNGTVTTLDANKLTQILNGVGRAETIELPAELQGCWRDDLLSNPANQ